MLAYNQFSSNASLRTLGDRAATAARGPSGWSILETDGMANQATKENFASSGANNSFYYVRPGDTVQTDSSTDPGQSAVNVLTRICALTTDNTNGPGFATPTKPVLVHCLAFGAVFEPTASGSEPAAAIAFLQQLSAIGGTGFPASVTDTTSPDFYKLCTGTLQQRQDKLRQAFTKIMDDGVAIVLVK